MSKFHVHVHTCARAVRTLQDDDVSSVGQVDILQVRMYHSDVTGNYPMLIEAVSFTQNGASTDYLREYSALII